MRGAKTPSASSSPALDAAAPTSRRLHVIPNRTSAVACRYRGAYDFIMTYLYRDATVVAGRAKTEKSASAAAHFKAKIAKDDKIDACDLAESIDCKGSALNGAGVEQLRSVSPDLHGKKKRGIIPSASAIGAVQKLSLIHI